jgi:hypothetical protein
MKIEFDLYTLAFLLLLLGILGVFGFFFANTIFNTMEATPLPGLIGFNTTAPKAVHQQAIQTFGFMDGIVAFVLVVMMGASLALAFYSRGRPFLAVVAIFTQILFVIAAYFVKLFWEGFSTSTPALNSVALTNFPITNVILTYIPFIGFVLLIGVIVVGFTKPSQEYAMGV